MSYLCIEGSISTTFEYLRTIRYTHSIHNQTEQKDTKKSHLGIIITSIRNSIVKNLTSSSPLGQKPASVHVGRETPATALVLLVMPPGRSLKSLMLITHLSDTRLVQQLTLTNRLATLLLVVPLSRRGHGGGPLGGVERVERRHSEVWKICVRTISCWWKGWLSYRGNLICSRQSSRCKS